MGMSFKRTTNVHCDGCSNWFAPADGDDSLPPGWEQIPAVGPWIGPFHACSPGCRLRVEARYQRPEPTESEFPPPPPGREDDTEPEIPVAGGEEAAPGGEQGGEPESGS